MIQARGTLFTIAALCAAAIAIALVMQYRFDMEPCPLCITQRIFVILVGLCACASALVMQQKLLSKGLMVAALISGLMGAAISARHTWIQHLPEDQVPSCGPSLAYMFETRPMFDALSLLFKGDGHCADVSFTLLGLSIPAWTLVFFVSMIVALVFVLTRRIK